MGRRVLGVSGGSEKEELGIPEGIEGVYYKDTLFTCMKLLKNK